MTAISTATKTALALALCAAPLSGALSAQDQTSVSTEGQIDVYGQVPADISELPKGPEVEGFISARKGEKIQVTQAGGAKSVLSLSAGTVVKSSGGFLNIGGKKLDQTSLYNGMPVTVQTVQWNGGLIASRISLKSKDLRTAAMIHNGTDQRFAANEAATEALRSRVADIDNYNVVGTTNVFFDTGKHALSGQAQADLCSAASQADGTSNALLLVVGYTDDVGDYDYNQELSEKRATRVVNYLQQACGWKPYRMLTPTGMAEADPAADNSTPEGKAQNRRVAVNILVSKAVEGL